MDDLVEVTAVGEVVGEDEEEASEEVGDVSGFGALLVVLSTAVAVLVALGLFGGSGEVLDDEE